MPDTKPSKAQLRSALRQRRRGLSTQQQRHAAQALTDSVTDLAPWASAQRIALYLAADAEIDTSALKELALEQGKTLFLPVITGDNSLEFAAWRSDQQLLPNRHNIPEPPAHAARCPAADLDIIFLPLVGWDLSGGRLGMGGGFYDRTLAGVTGPSLVGLAHTCQQVEETPLESWDICLDFVATDTALHRCRQSQES